MTEKKPELTPALEDYLEAIFVLQQDKPEVKVMDIAEYLKVTMASVTGSMRKLADMKYVEYHKRRNVKLTPSGAKVARSVRRRHDELYTFYHDVLGAPGDQSEASACKVEHVLDPSIIERIIRLTHWIKKQPEETQNDFRRDVRKADGGLTVEKKTLAQVQPGGKVKIKKVSGAGGIGRRIMDMGLIRGTEVEVIRVAPLADPIDIKFKGYHLSLRKSEAAKIEVE